MCIKDTLQGRPGAVAAALPMLSARCAPAKFKDDHLSDGDDCQSQYGDHVGVEDEPDGGRPPTLCLWSRLASAG